VLFLAALRERCPDLAPRLLCGSLAAAEALADKWLGYRFCLQRGLPFVESMLAGAAVDVDALVRDGWLPCIAKPRRGFASRDIRIVCTPGQLHRTAARDDCVIQRFIGEPSVITDFLAGLDRDGVPLFHTFQGVKHSIQALVGPGGEVVHVYCTRNDLSLRRAKRVEPDRDPAARDLGERCARAFAEAGWRGPLNIQCRKSASGELTIHEFNGRFTGATAVRWHLGFDEIGPTLAHFTGFAPDGPYPRREPAREAHEGLASRSASPERVDALVRAGTWRAA
jgi:carbamoyl-phosphate synthase large subunit